MADLVPAGNGNDGMMLALIQRAAADPAFDIMKFQALLDAWKAERAVRAHRMFNEAMANASADMQAIPKDASNDYLRSRYAKLDGMLSVIKPITSKWGLAFRFGTEPHPDPDWMTVTCILSLGDHEETTALPGPILSGEGIKGGKTQMNNLQAVGGTVTYLSRYLLGMVFTLIQHMPDIAHDDDGGDPTREPNNRRQSPPSRPPYQKPRDNPPGQAQGGATGDGAPTEGNGTSKWKAGLEIALAGTKTLAELTAWISGEKFVAWRAKASAEQENSIAAMIALRREALTAAPPAAPDAPPPPAADPAPSLEDPPA